MRQKEATCVLLTEDQLVQAWNLNLSKHRS
jgi:hypothetical protein